MNETDYAKAGRIVYDTERLLTAVSGLAGWMSGSSHMLDASNERLLSNARHAIENYFNGKHDKEQVQAQLLTALQMLRKLEACRPGLVTLSSHELDRHLAMSKKTHSMLADVFDDLGYEGFPSAALRRAAE